MDYKRGWIHRRWEVQIKIYSHIFQFCQHLFNKLFGIWKRNKRDKNKSGVQYYLLKQCIHTNRFKLCFSRVIWLDIKYRWDRFHRTGIGPYLCPFFEEF